MLNFDLQGLHWDHGVFIYTFHLLFPWDEKNTRGKIVTLLFTNMVIESARSVILENPIHCIYYTCNYTTGYEKFKQSSIPPISAKQTINTNLNSLNAIWHWKQHVGLEQTGPHLSSHWKLTCSRHDIAEKFSELALNNNHSLTLEILVLAWDRQKYVTGLNW